MKKIILSLIVVLVASPVGAMWDFCGDQEIAPINGLNCKKTIRRTDCNNSTMQEICILEDGKEEILPPAGVNETTADNLPLEGAPAPVTRPAIAQAPESLPAPTIAAGTLPNCESLKGLDHASQPVPGKNCIEAPTQAPALATPAGSTPDKDSPSTRSASGEKSTPEKLFSDFKCGTKDAKQALNQLEETYDSKMSSKKWGENWDKAYGSSQLTKCIRYTRGLMTTFFKENASSPNIEEQINWGELALLEKSVRKICETEIPDETKRAEQIPNFKKKIESVQKEFPRCVSAAWILNRFGRSWSNDEHIKAQAPGATQQTQAQAQAQGIGGVQCQSNGVETVDYEPCKSYNNHKSIFDVSQQAFNSGQQMYFQSKSMDRAAEASKNGAKDPTAPLKFQKDSLSDQSDMLQTRGAIDAAKAGMIISDFNSMPSMEDVTSKCTGLNTINNNPLEGTQDSTDLEKYCKEKLVVAGNDSFTFLMNERQKDKMKADMIKAGIDSLANMAMANLADKQAGKVGNAIAKVEEFKPELTPGIEDAVLVDFCKTAPTDPKCASVKLERDISGIGDQSINFGSGGTGISYSDGSKGTTGSNGAISNNDPTKRNTNGVVGSAIKSAGNSNELETVASAGSVKEGSALGGGPGGGGPGGGSAGLSGSGSSPTGPQGPTTITPGSSNKLFYGGGGGVGVSSVGGLGLKSGSKKGDDKSNPFGSLFDKGKGQNGEKVLNFRGVASESVADKSGNIFEMISNRYNSVNNEKRLLEYQEAK